jgi:hypothetical protein
MDHIYRLTQERDRAHARFIQMQDALIDLQAYLASRKFHGIENDWVSAREMWSRVQEIRVDAWRD